MSKRTLETLLLCPLGAIDMYGATSVSPYVHNVTSPNTYDYFMIYNMGNLQNGFVYALLIDILLENAINIFSKKFENNGKILKVLNFIRDGAYLSCGIFSALAITTLELTSFGNRGDINDIPAGILGAAFYTGLRYFSYNREKAKESSF